MSGKKFSQMEILIWYGDEIDYICALLRHHFPSPMAFNKGPRDRPVEPIRTVAQRVRNYKWTLCGQVSPNNPSLCAVAVRYPRFVRPRCNSGIRRYIKLPKRRSCEEFLLVYVGKFFRQQLGDWRVWKGAFGIILPRQSSLVCLLRAEKNTIPFTLHDRGGWASARGGLHRWTGERIIRQ